MTEKMNQNEDQRNQRGGSGGEVSGRYVAVVTGLMAIVAGTVLLLILVQRQPPEQKDQPEVESEPKQKKVNLSRGKEVYNQYCQSCHGEDGSGDGPAAVYLYPKPRDFTTGLYKFTSTPNGELPLDRDLEKTVSEGLSGTGMPGFSSVLKEKDIRAVVDYVKTFSDLFERMEPAEPVDVPEPEPADEELVQRGKEVYNNLDCWTCHGRKGKGDGPSAARQTDHKDRKVRPRDFSKGSWKWGNTAKDLYRVIFTGINGVGMPGYRDQVKNDRDRWALVRYIQSLADREGPRLILPETVSVTYSDTLPSSPEDKAWKNIDETRLEVHPLWERPVPAPSLHVAAMHNGQRVTFRLRWHDASKNEQALQQTSFADAAALQFPVASSRYPPFPGMGDDSDKGLVRIWHWTAQRQKEAEKGRPLDLEDIYKDMFADRYPWLGTEPGNAPDIAGGDTNIAKQDPDFQSAIDAKNPVADPKLVHRSVLEYVAKGFGTLTAVSRDNLHATGDGTWSNGSWKVTFTREMNVEGEQDRSFSNGDKGWLGFAVFDGKYRERNGKKSISQWVQFSFEEKNND